MMTIREVKTRQEWEQFVLSLSPNTFLHSWEWGQVQRADGEGVRYLGIWEGVTQVAACLLLTVHARRGIHYLIPHGPISRPEASYESIMRAICDYARGTAPDDRAVALRVAPLVTVDSPQQSVFAKLRFRPAPLHVHAELTWMLDIQPDESTVLQGMRKTTRHAISRAIGSGVTTEIVPADKIVDRFWPLYERTGSRHQFVLYSKQLIAEQLKVFSDTDRVFSVVAKYQGADVAAAILFHYGSTVFYYHGASRQLPALSPTQLLQFTAIKEAKRRGATHYNFWGIAPPDQPQHPFAGITVFKRGFGGYSIDYLHAQDYPLSPSYWKLWLIETVRRIRRGFSLFPK